MLKIRKINSLLCASFLLCFAGVSAQNHLNSPYSRFGLGDISPRTSSANAAMGGTGLAFKSPTAVNFSNPASYIAYDSMAALFDAAFSYKNQTLTAETSQKGGTIYVDYLAFGLPVSKWWKTTFGFQPFSTVSYTVHDYSKKETDSIVMSFLGSGGINEVYWGNAFRLFKNFSIGFNASFLFGEYSKSRTVESTDLLFANALISNDNQIKGLYLTLGTQYFIPVKEKGTLGFGAVYTPSIPVFSKVRNLTVSYLNMLDANGKPQEIKRIDTSYDSKHSIPQSIGGGISWSKGQRYFIGADFTWTNWANYAIDDVNDSLTNSYKIALGGNYTPNPTGLKYFSKITFSLGTNYEQTCLKFNDIQLNKYGVNFGVQFPMKRSKTSLGAIFEYGQMGTTRSGLIRQNYFKATISVRIHEQWYQRKKLD